MNYNAMLWLFTLTLLHNTAHTSTTNSNEFKLNSNALKSLEEELLAK